VFAAAVLALSILVVWLSGRLLGWQLGAAGMLLVFFGFAALGRILLAFWRYPGRCSSDSA